MFKSIEIYMPHRQCERSFKSMFESLGMEVYPGSSNLAFKRKTDIIASIKCFHITKLLKTHPEYKNRMLWCDINGGTPGNDVGYKTLPINPLVPYIGGNKQYEGRENAYIVYIPFMDKEGYLEIERKQDNYIDPVGFIHNVRGWGYGQAANYLSSAVGYKVFGGFGNKFGPIKEPAMRYHLTNSIAYIQCKGRDCPGFSLYQAMFAGCPVILPSNFLRRTMYTDLYEPGVTCLVANDDRVSPEDKPMQKFCDNVLECLEQLKDPKENKRIGDAARQRACEVIWDANNSECVDSFKKFIYKHLSL